MAALSPEVKAFIVQALACFDTPTKVVEQVKQEFGLAVALQQVKQNDPAKVRTLVRRVLACYGVRTS